MCDYLIVTASNEAQGVAYERQLGIRQHAGHLPEFRHVMVVTDPDGKRIGSGGSTLLCVMKVLKREQRQTLHGLRIMIIHAGGDSRRLPAYGPCGKIFIPVPGQATPSGNTLFDRLIPCFLALPPGRPEAGQLLVISGDVLLQFDPSNIRMDLPGLIALACYDTPEHSSKHGVFVPAGTNVRCYLQKPSPAEQHAAGALNASGLSALDMGVMSFDADAVALMLTAAQIAPSPDGTLDWSPAMKTRIFTQGLDLYREICCALGTETTQTHFLKTVRDSGSKWEEQALDGIFSALRPMPFHVQVVPECKFLHFGTTRQLISSGLELAGNATTHGSSILTMNTTVTGTGTITGTQSWVEGCRVTAPLSLTEHNVLVGGDVAAPLSLPPNACLDIVPGVDRQGKPVYFIRCYGIGDTFKDSIPAGGTFCGRPLLQWLQAAGVTLKGVQSLWDARVFPAVRDHQDFRKWLWMFNPETATAEEKAAYRAADRYSTAEITIQTNLNAFDARRNPTRQ